MPGWRRTSVAAAIVALSIIPVATPARADRVDDKRREAAQIADQLDRLQGQAFDLGERYDDVAVRLSEVERDVAASKSRLAQLELQLGTLRSSMAQFAVRTYVYGTQGSGLAVLLSGSGGATEAAQRSRYTELVLQGSVADADTVQTVAEDATAERARLEAKQAEQETLKAQLEQQKSSVEGSIQDYQALQQKVKGELAQLVAEEQARRAAAAAAAARAQAAASSSNGGAGGQVVSGQSTRRGNGSSAAAAVRNPASKPASKPSSRPSAGGYVPPSTPGAGGAVAAALSQVGVAYRYATASPGVAFDCSGLTSWAWAQAGRSLPRNSRAQSAALPNVPRDQIQPGDLVFYYSPISHVGMYIGGGQLVHATRPGDVVKVASVSWDKVVDIGRPA